jgi:hypothetical protein
LTVRGLSPRQIPSLVGCSLLHAGLARRTVIEIFHQLTSNTARKPVALIELTYLPAEKLRIARMTA